MQDNIQEDMKTKFSFSSFCEEAVSLLLMAYLFVIFFLYPYYMRNGYANIGRDKFSFYRDITVGGFALIIPFAIFCLIYQFRDHKKMFSLKRLSITDGAVFIYLISVLLSFAFTQFKQEALWGERGWYMGLVTQLLFILSYYLVSRFWEFEENIILVILAASAGVFLLGLLNRFSVFPIELAGATNDFISTLGNINWYCGYWSVLFPVGFTLYWMTGRRWLRMIAMLYVALGLGTGISQGSNSAFIVIAGLYLILFCLSFRVAERMRRFFELMLLFCMTSQGLRLWRILIPDSFDYYSGTVSDWITSTSVTLYLMLPLGIIYVLLLLADRKKDMDIRRYKMFRQITLLILTITIGVYILLLIWNTRTKGGIRFLGGQPLLIFSEYWGSARGGTWSAGWNLFKSMPAWQKLIGVGPDCFGFHLYTVPDVMEAVVDQFGKSRLTNAHNEWLTVLVNNGIIGFIGYAGIFISVCIRYLKKAENMMKSSNERVKCLYIFAICAFAYSIHNIVSFQQILSTPFIFLMLGMGERLMREIKFSGGEEEKVETEVDK